MRETDERVTCECGRWRWAGAVDGWVEQYHHRHIAVRGHESFYCWDCHTELSFDADGRPVAQAMVPKAAYLAVCDELAAYTDSETKGWQQWGQEQALAAAGGGDGDETDAEPE